MNRCALYGRVSTDRQEQEETIQSQMAELKQQAKDDGIDSCLELTDEGYGRDTLARPGLDRLRDLAVAGELNRVYVQSPDRLASGAKLIILVEELQQNGVEVVFFKGAHDDTPEGKLLLHMQGAIAEYERTKIAERTRRGKLYWARQGAMVGGHAPYGFRYVRRSDQSRGRLEVSEPEASEVRNIYCWLVEEGMSTRAIARRLTELGILTSRKAAQWQPTALDRILRNPVYKGTFYYQRTESVIPSRRVTADLYRRRRKSGSRPRPEEDWIAIPVPSIVSQDLWEAAQAQLKQNSLHSRRNNKRNLYLLRGLIRCCRCGSTYTGATQHGYRRYRCTRADATVSSTGKPCSPGSLSADGIEVAVWDAVTDALKQPQVLIEEYQRRVAANSQADPSETQLAQIDLDLKRIRKQEDRLTDAYLREVVDLQRFGAEMETLKERRLAMTRVREEVETRRRQTHDTEEALQHLERFCHRISQGLKALTFEERQRLLRLVVEQIKVDDGRVYIETVIPTGDDDVQLRTRHPEHVEG